MVRLGRRSGAAAVLLLGILVATPASPAGAEEGGPAITIDSPRAEPPLESGSVTVSGNARSATLYQMKDVTLTIGSETKTKTCTKSPCDFSFPVSRPSNGRYELKLVATQALPLVGAAGPSNDASRTFYIAAPAAKPVLDAPKVNEARNTELSWSRNTEPDMLYYAVFRKDPGGTKYQPAGSVTQPSSGTKVSFTDTTTSAFVGGDYSYQVVAVRKGAGGPWPPEIASETSVIRTATVPPPPSTTVTTAVPGAPPGSPPAGARAPPPPSSRAPPPASTSPASSPRGPSRSPCRPSPFPSRRTPASRAPCPSAPARRARSWRRARVRPCCPTTAVRGRSSAASAPDARSCRWRAGWSCSSWPCTCGSSITASRPPLRTDLPVDETPPAAPAPVPARASAPAPTPAPEPAPPVVLYDVDEEWAVEDFAEEEWAPVAAAQPAPAPAPEPEPEPEPEPVALWAPTEIDDIDEPEPEPEPEPFDPDAIEVFEVVSSNRRRLARAGAR